jgi:hypothetical protein
LTNGGEQSPFPSKSGHFEQRLLPPGFCLRAANETKSRYEIQSSSRILLNLLELKESDLSHQYSFSDANSGVYRTGSPNNFPNTSHQISHTNGDTIFNRNPPSPSSPGPQITITGQQYKPKIPLAIPQLKFHSDSKNIGSQINENYKQQSPYNGQSQNSKSIEFPFSEDVPRDPKNVNSLPPTQNLNEPLINYFCPQKSIPSTLLATSDEFLQTSPSTPIQSYAFSDSRTLLNSKTSLNSNKSNMNNKTDQNEGNKNGNNHSNGKKNNFSYIVNEQKSEENKKFRQILKNKLNLLSVEQISTLVKNCYNDENSN